jgi:hypothetical protein
LEQVLNKLPDPDVAIVQEEGSAWRYQLNGEIDLAIRHRQREIELIERLQKSVCESVDAGQYGDDVADWALNGRDAACLEERRAILKSLLELREQA